MSRRKRMHGRRRKRSPLNAERSELTWVQRMLGQGFLGGGDKKDASDSAAASKNTVSAQQEASEAASAGSSEGGGGGHGEHSHGGKGIGNIAEKEKPWNVGDAIGEMEGMDRMGKREYMEGLDSGQRGRVKMQQMKDRMKGGAGGWGQRTFGW